MKMRLAKRRYYWQPGRRWNLNARVRDGLAFAKLQAVLLDRLINVLADDGLSPER